MKAKVILVVLLVLTAVMAWEAVSPSSFVRVFRRPFRDAIEIAYFTPLIGAAFFAVRASCRLVFKRDGRLRSGLHTALAVLWLVVLAWCVVLMGVRMAL